MKYLCNPINFEYKYQFHPKDGQLFANREAADPSMVLFKGMYYLFPSMTGGFLASKDLANWEFHSFKNKMPIYDYAPDVCVKGDYIYFSASKRQDNCSFYRSTDPINLEFEEVEEAFPFWDPHLFADEDGRMYFYWGCSNIEPLYGVEVDPLTMQPLSEKIIVITENTNKIGYERAGADHVGKTEAEIEMRVQEFLKKMPNLPDSHKPTIYKVMGNAPYMEGAWMTKHNGKYYLQYAAPGTQYNVYADGVYVGERPLGPFTLAKNNPYSYKPGGFINGAGHGSTMKALDGQYWHTSTMAISHNHNFERRLGIWQAGIDDDGELFCDQRYGDWPLRVDQKPWDKPDWMLLSYGKKVTASSGTGLENVTDENILTWWQADTSGAGEWIIVDLGQECNIHGIQVNFADDQLAVELPEGEILNSSPGMSNEERFIDLSHQLTRWILEGSCDGVDYFVIEDKSNVETDLPHDFIVNEEGGAARYLKLTIVELPYNQVPKVSGLRAFGKVDGELPTALTDVQVELVGDLDMFVNWQSNASGHNVLWGYAADKLYHSYMVFGKNEQKIGALIKGQPLYVRVDTFNEVGITEGNVVKVK